MQTPKTQAIKHFPKLAILITCVVLPSVAKADTVTLVATNLVTASFSVPSNVVAQVVYMDNVNGGNVSLNLTIGGITRTFNKLNGTWGILPNIAGPATITITDYDMPSSAAVPTAGICTVQTSSATSTPTNSLPFLPSTAVVILADAFYGPVTIILESSVDLINWSLCLPGTDGTTTSNRFFRVRAQR